MGLTFAILTSDIITPVEFINFLPQAGARHTPNEPSEGQIDKDSATIWVGIDNTVHPCIEEDEGSADEWRMILQKLGAAPQTSIVVETLGFTSADSDLAFEFAYAFSQRWPCVFDNLFDYVYSAEELQELHRTGRSTGEKIS